MRGSDMRGSTVVKNFFPTIESLDVEAKGILVLPPPSPFQAIYIFIFRVASILRDFTFSSLGLPPPFQAITFKFSSLLEAPGFSGEFHISTTKDLAIQRLVRACIRWPSCFLCNCA